MGTEILRPQDCLTDRIRFNPAMCSRRRNCGYANPNYYSYSRPNRKQAVRHHKPDQRRQQRAQSEPSMSRRSIYDDSKSKRSSSDDLRADNNDLVMKKVTILRLGDSLDLQIKSGNGTVKKEGEGSVVTGAVRLGPARDVVPKQNQMAAFKSSVTVKSDVYAGSAFAVSPAPSSLPLPSFSKKKQVSTDDSATRDIKRLLRLDL